MSPLSGDSNQQREEFWRDLIAHFHPRLRAYCRALRCSDDEIEEILWDVWQEAAASEATLAASGDQWPILQPLVRRVCAIRARYWRRERPLDADAVGSEPTDQFEELESQKSLRVWTDRVLQALPAQQRLAVDFRCRWGWPYWAVAAALETSEVTARVHVARGLQRLRQLAASAPP